MKSWGKRTRNTEVTAFDEGASNGKNLTGTQGEVERCGDGRSTLEHVQHGTVARLDCHDASSISQDAWVSDEVRSTQIRPDANVLDDTRSRDHGLHIREHRRKVVCATRGRCTAERTDNGLWGVINCQKKDGKMEEKRDTYLDNGDMGALIVLDGCDLLDGAVWG
jgi:hypothetical protein